MKRLSNIYLKKTYKYVFLFIVGTLILACNKEEAEFICSGDFVLEKRIVRDTSTNYTHSFPFVKKCFKIASVQKSIDNNQLKLDIKLVEVGEGVLSNYLIFTLLSSNISNINLNDIEAYAKISGDFKLGVQQYLHNHHETGINFNSASSLQAFHDVPKIKSGVYNFKVLSLDKDAKTLTFTMDKIIGITGRNSYVEYKGFIPLTIKILD